MHPPLRDATQALDPILDRVRGIANTVGLRDYTFEVNIGRLEPGVRAVCRCVEGRAFAVITVGEDFFSLSPEEQNEALVHETLHPLFHRLMEHILDLRGELSRTHFEAVERVFRRDLEHVVDALTHTVAEAIGAEDAT